ncbi:aspartate--tRNA ligase [Vulcanibacillus modesticaldus]|uniref:Aspartate--tRNA ligase n=1 Tax=Vulcanibacillus modesticaldus TaxID=337097 RepID=A0A1D2YTC4_9BACI|nr:aspartate--tRNA ligase [Vulcanibacillus modesticaldus]OEF98926.1 aspartate--tRNA ligase [Vulcanibacillus modesticaldus]
MVLQRTHQGGKLNKSLIGTEVILSGWVQKRRDLGGLIFIDLRDRSGIVQLVINPEKSQKAHQVADKLRSEYVIAVKGIVVAREEETVNPNMETGEIEVEVSEIELINEAKTPPFFIQDNIEIDESLRLKYRYLDLRRNEMKNTLILRHKVTTYIRNFLDKYGFLDIETPMLTKSTPEGARDYLVASRKHPGHFFALPQSPQLFKQLLMVSGFERYYQVTRCFRDEDLRADRQPEFTQVDIEMSFMPLKEFQDLMEEMMVGLFKETIGYEIERPFLRMTYQEAMERYGSDKPDIRFGMELKDISEIVKESEFKVFRNTIQNGGQVKGINAKGCASYSRKDVDQLTEFVSRYGAKGLAWLSLKEDGIKGSIVKFLSESEIEQIKTTMEAETGDLLLFVADSKEVVADALGNLRLELGKRLNLIPENVYKFLWITDFPLVSYDEEQQRYVAEHHPFTMPREEDIPLLDTDPSKVRAQAYDMVLNGYELGGGSLRIYQQEIQEKMFNVLGFTKEEAWDKFGFLLEAFEYGTPPHGGIAFGLDRLVMILANRNNLRDTIAFPKTTNANCLLTGAPTFVDDKQLKELHLEIKAKVKETEEIV